MKRLLTVLVVAMLMFSSLVYAAGDKNVGSIGKGEVGDIGDVNNPDDIENRPNFPDGTPDLLTPSYEPPIVPPYEPPSE